MRVPTRAFQTIRPRDPPREGVTLIELVLVLGMLVMVLGVSYQVIIDCLEADRTIDRLTKPEKVAEGILALVRNDLSGTVYRNLGRRVFLVADGGQAPDARDELRFVTTVEPTPVEDSMGGTMSILERRSLLAVAYTLVPSQLEDGTSAFALHRKEMIDFDIENPLESPGTSYEIYDKVQYLSVECFDGLTWYSDWDSEARIQAEESELAAEEEAANSGVARVSDPQRTGLTTPGVDPTLETENSQLILPPAAVPVAVRVEIGVYVAVGNKLLRDPQGAPLVKTYATIVPLLVAQRIPIEIEDEMLDQGGGGLADGGGGAAGGGGLPGGGGMPGGPGGGRGGEGGRGMQGGGPGGRGMPAAGGAPAGGPRPRGTAGGGRAGASGAPTGTRVPIAPTGPGVSGGRVSPR